MEPDKTAASEKHNHNSNHDASWSRTFTLTSPLSHGALLMGIVKTFHFRGLSLLPDGHFGGGLGSNPLLVYSQAFGLFISYYKAHASDCAPVSSRFAPGNGVVFSFLSPKDRFRWLFCSQIITASHYVSPTMSHPTYNREKLGALTKPVNLSSNCECDKTSEKTSWKPMKNP